MRWHWVADKFTNKKQWVSHAIPEVLYKAVMESLHQRGFHYYETTELVEGDRVVIDLPGMIMMNREFRGVNIDGLTIEIPCTDWEVLYSVLAKSEVRTDAALPYYKLHGWHRCICLTPQHRDNMLQAMDKLMVEVNLQREIENRHFNDAFANSPRIAVADGPQDVKNALERAEAAGKRPSIIVSKRPTKKGGDA